MGNPFSYQSSRPIKCPLQRRPITSWGNPILSTFLVIVMVHPLCLSHLLNYIPLEGSRCVAMTTTQYNVDWLDNKYTDRSLANVCSFFIHHYKLAVPTTSRPQQIQFACRRKKLNTSYNRAWKSQQAVWSVPVRNCMETRLYWIKVDHEKWNRILHIHNTTTSGWQHPYRRT